MNCYAIDCPEEMVGLRVYFLYGGVGLKCIFLQVGGLLNIGI